MAVASLTIADAETQTEVRDQIVSTIIDLSRLTHGWLYDYAKGNNPDEIIGFPIWPDDDFGFHPPIKYGEPGDQSY